MVPVATQQGSRAGWALKVNGANYTTKVPLDEGAVRITESLGSPAQMEFTIEDPRGVINLQHGHIVQFDRTRLTASGETQTAFRHFAGHLLDTDYTVLPGSTGRLIKCRAIGFEAWLDWKAVPNYSSRTNVDGRIRQVHSDRAIVQELVSKWGALITAGPFVDATNTGMSVVGVQGVTLREALERVADVATIISPESTRDFYVDHYHRLHYYSGSEGLEAPFRIAAGSYTNTVLDEGALSGLLTLGEAAGATAYNYPFPGASGTFNGTYTRGSGNLIWNEPAYTGTRLTGAGYLALTDSGYHPGDEFTLECVFKRNSTGSTQTLVSAGAGDYLVQFTVGNQLRIERDGVGDNFLSDDTFTDANPHHLMISHEPGTTAMYIDGVALAGTHTNRTFVAAAGDVNWGRNVTTSAAFFDGWLSHLAHYTTKKTAAVALEHANQWKSLSPEGIEYSRTSGDVIHRVYVKGANAQGSGWVDPPGSSFAGRHVDAFLDEPDSTGPAKRNAYGRAFIRQHRRVDSIRYAVTHAFSGWTLGQLVTIDVPQVGLDESPQEIRELNTDFNLGNGQITYEMVLGDPRPATFHRGRRRRRRR